MGKDCGRSNERLYQKHELCVTSPKGRWEGRKFLHFDAKINHYLKLMYQQYILHWQHTLQHFKKLEFYNNFKNEYRPSYYLDFTRKITDRKALVKLRIGNHRLIIECGRYNQIPREHRLCPPCRSNELEDEIRFLFNCPKYSIPRDKFYSSKVQLCVHNMKQWPPVEEIKKLMNSFNYCINFQLMKLILSSFDLRSKLLNLE